MSGVKLLEYLSELHLQIIGATLVPSTLVQIRVALGCILACLAYRASKCSISRLCIILCLILGLVLVVREWTRSPRSRVCRLPGTEAEVSVLNLAETLQRGMALLVKRLTIV